MNPAMTVAVAAICFATGLLVGDWTAEPRYRDEMTARDAAAAASIKEARAAVESARKRFATLCWLPWGPDLRKKEHTK